MSYSVTLAPLVRLLNKQPRIQSWHLAIILGHVLWYELDASIPASDFKSSLTLILILFLLGYLYLCGMWLGVPPITDIQKRFVFKILKLQAQNMIPILGSIVKIIGGKYMTN